MSSITKATQDPFNKIIPIINFQMIGEVRKIEAVK